MFFITLDQLLKMCLIMGLGFLCCKARVIDENGNRTLSNLVIMVVQPMVFIEAFFIERNPEVLRNFFLSCGLAALIFAITVPAAHFLFRKRPDDRTPIDIFSVIYTNCGFLGIPVIQALLGSEGVLYLTPYIFVFNLTVWTHGIVLMSGQTGKKQVIKGLTSPAILAMFLGLILLLSGISLPPLLKETVSSVAAMNTPMGMLIAGISLGFSDIRSILTSSRPYVVCAVRLILLPLLTLLIFRWIPAPKILLYVNLIACACPAGTTCTMFALRFGRDHRYASGIFALSTIFSLGTIPVYVYIMERFLAAVP